MFKGHTGRFMCLETTPVFFGFDFVQWEGHSCNMRGLGFIAFSLTVLCIKMPLPYSWKKKVLGDSYKVLLNFLEQMEEEKLEKETGNELAGKNREASGGYCLTQLDSE